MRDNGEPIHPDSIAYWLNKFSDEHDIPHLHPHAFRHTAASTLIASGVDLVTTAAEMGHANAATTAAIYAHEIALTRANAADESSPKCGVNSFRQLCRGCLASLVYPAAQGGRPVQTAAGEAEPVP